MRKILFILLFFTSVLLKAQTTYYVSTTGDNGGVGSIGDPWQTLAYAEDHATTAGDVIALKKGDTFTVSYLAITHGGSAGNYITWDGSLWGSGANAIIDISGDISCSIVAITGCDYVKFQNITVEGNSHNSYAGILVGGLDDVTVEGTQNDEQYIYIDSCTIQNIRSTTWSPGILVQTDHNNISHVFVQNNTITNISNHGIAWYNGKVSDGADDDFATIDSYCGYNTIDLCGRLENEVSSCIMITQDVRGMICEYNNLTGGGDGDAPGIAVGGGSQGVWPTDLIIRYNYINCQSGEHAINFNQGGDITCEVYYNILFADNIPAIEIFASGSPNYTNADMEFYNNTIVVSTGYHAFKNGCSIVGSATFKNNICYSSVAGQYGGYVIVCSTTGNTVHSDNLLYRTEATNCYHVLDGSNYTRSTASTWEPTVVVTDPTFVTNFSDLHLQAGSPAIGAGADLSLPYDYEGDVVLNPPAIGAYEYGSAPEGDLPVAVTSSITSVKSIFATISGSVTGTLITARGFVWDTSINPTTSSSIIIMGTGEGSLSFQIRGLSPSTTYYGRTFATNSEGTTYGANISWTTPSYSVGKTSGKVGYYNGKIGVIK